MHKRRLERAARETEIETEVTAALQEAERWQKQEKWPEALSAVKQAEGLLTAGGSDELRERVHQLRKDLEMVLRLEEIPLPASQEYGKWWDWETEDRAYRQAFADYGIDVAEPAGRRGGGPDSRAARGGGPTGRCTGRLGLLPRSQGSGRPSDAGGGGASR